MYKLILVKQYIRPVLGKKGKNEQDVVKTEWPGSGN